MSVQTTIELKALQTRQDKLQAELKEAKNDLRESEKKVREIQAKLTSVEQQIKQLSAAEADIIISEHAYLRYFTRVLGFDLEKIKEEILSPKIENAIHTLKSGVFPSEGFKLKVKNKTIVTLITD